MIVWRSSYGGRRNDKGAEFICVRREERAEAVRVT